MESGTHDVLMAKNGLYSNLINAQIKPDNGDDNKNEFSSDEEFEGFNLDDENITTESVTATTEKPLNIRTIKRQTSIKVLYAIKKKKTFSI